MSANPQDPYARAVSETTSGFGQLDSEFQAKFGRPLRVTAGQNAEHKRLHPGGAWDIGGKDLKPEEGDFVTSRAPQLGLNVSDYRKAAPHTTTTGVRITGPHIHLDLDQGNDPYAQAVKDVGNAPERSGQGARVQRLLTELKTANPSNGLQQSPARKRRMWTLPPSSSSAPVTPDKVAALKQYVQGPIESPEGMEQRTMARARQLNPPKKTFAGRVPSSLERFTGGASDVLAGMAEFPLSVAKTAVTAITGKPIEAGHQLWDMFAEPQLAEYRKAQELAKAKGYKDGRAALADPEVLGHFGAALLPMLGPMAAHAGERIGTGDIAGGLGEAAGILAPMAWHATKPGEAFKGKPEALAGTDPYAKAVTETQSERNVPTGEVQPVGLSTTAPTNSPSAVMDTSITDPYAKAVSETRAAVDRPQARLIPQDEPVEVPEGQTSTKVSGVGTLVHEPNVSHAEVRAAVREGRTDELLKSPAKSGPIPPNEFISSADRGLSAEAEGAGLPAARPSTPITTESQGILARIEAAKQQWQAKQDEQAKGQEAESQVSAAVPEVRGETAAAPIATAPQEAARRYKPLAHNSVVDGRRVINADNIPNLSSIDSSVDNPKVLPGIHEVPMSEFELTGKHYSVEGQKRIDSLAEQIKHSKEVTPLIVVMDKEGAYILEGATRVDALYNLGAKSFPAKVVLDMDSFGEQVAPVEAPKVEAGGKEPLTFQAYHGTQSEPFEEFRTRGGGQATDAASAKLGAFFTENKSDAQYISQSYGARRLVNKGDPRVLAAKLTLRAPFDVASLTPETAAALPQPWRESAENYLDMKSKVPSADEANLVFDAAHNKATLTDRIHFYNGHPELIAGRKVSKISSGEYAADQLRLAGYDGIIFHTKQDSVSGGARQFIVFEPSQIERMQQPAESTPAAKPVVESQPEEIHHSELQPRDDTGHFDGPPENYTPKAERERSLPDTLEEGGLPGGTNRTYEPISNEVSLARANQNIKTKGLDGAAEWVKGQNEPSAEHTATGLRVISELQKAGRYDEAVDVAGDLSDKLTRQGQAIQAVQVLNQLAPERALLVAERMAKKYKTRLDAQVITEKAAAAQADDARLKFLEGEVERLTTEAAKGAPKKTATTGLTGRLNERAQSALAKLQNRPLDLKGISQGAELGAVTVNPRGALEGDAELLAEYGASTLGKSMDEWKGDIRKRFGEIPDAQLDTIARRAYDIRSEERINDLAERMASGDAQAKRSAGAEIGQSIRDAEKEARQAEAAANKAKRQVVTQAADTAARTARIQEGIRLDAEKEDARQKLADARREGVEAKRAADKIERERIAAQKDEARKAAQWTAPFKMVADAARQGKTNEPMNLDDTTAVAADIIAPKTPQQSVARGLNAAQFYREIEAQTGVDRKTAKEVFKRAYQRVDDARTAAREVARIQAATGGQAGSLTDAQLQSILAQREAAQRDANRSRQDLASEFQKLQMTTGQRIVHNFVKGSRQVLLSGITTVEKLGAFGAVEQVMRPARDLVGAGLKRLPGVKTVASQAPREGSGFNARAQAAGVAKYLRTTVETFTPGTSAVRDYVKTGHADIDVKYGKADSLPPEVAELFGRLHGALKLPAKLAEFETSARIRLEHAINQGLDPTDPMVITTAMEGAYVDANRAIMLADNMVSDFFKAGKTKWQQGGAVGKYAAMGIETLFPITKVPVNIVAETARYSPIGTLTSVGEILVRGMRGTLGELEPAQADRIMRTLKKSTLGTLLYAMAYAVPGIIQIGGYKKKGEKEEDLKIKPDTMRVFGVDIGRQWIHHPVFITMQTMATIRRLHDQYGYTDASLTAAKQNLQHVPYLEEPSKALEALGSEDAMRNFFGTLIRSRIEPPDLQRAARIGDQPETTAGSKRAQFFGLTPEQQATRRYPKTTGEIMQMGIPGQREKVPAVSVSRTLQTPTTTHYLSDKQYGELRKATSDSVNEAMKTARAKLADLTLAQRRAASKYIANQIEAKERDRLKLRLDKEYADSTAGDNAFDRIHKPLDEIISEAREKVKEGKFDRKARVIQQ